MSEKKRSIFIKFLGYTIPFLLVFYVLSFGPVGAKVFHLIRDALDTGEIDPIFSLENFDTFYTPLKWAVKYNPFIEDLLYDYMGFCSDSIYPEDRQEYFELLQE